MREFDDKFVFNQNSLLSYIKNLTINEHEGESIIIALTANSFETQLISNLVKKIKTKLRNRFSKNNAKNANAHLYDVAIVTQFQE